MEFEPKGNLLKRFHDHLEDGETSDRTFGLVVGSLLLALSFAPELRHRSPVVWMAVAGAPLLVLGAVAPRFLRSVKLAWLFLGFAIGQVVNPLVLGVLFFAVITPCGLLMRLFGGDPLRLKPTTFEKPHIGADPVRPEKSYWLARTAPISSMKDQF